MSTLEDMKERLVETSPTPATPFYADYVLSSDAPPPAIDPDLYPGLLFYYVRHKAQEPPLVASYWVNREQHMLHGESFGRGMGAATPNDDGFVTRLTARKASWIKRVPWYTVIVSIAAFLGALHAIGTYFDWIFTAPQLALKSAKTRIHLLEGAEIRETPTLANSTAAAHRDVVLKAVLSAKSGAAVPLSTNPSVVAHIPAGAAQELVISGSAPAPGDYELVLSASARAGVLRSAQAGDFRQPVSVWPKSPAGGLGVQSITGERAVLAGTIPVGAAAPNGLDCELEIQGVPGLGYVLLEYPRLYQTPEWLTTEEPGKEVASLRWAVLPVGQFERLAFQVGLLGSSTTDWAKVTANARVRCFYRKEKIRDAT